MRIAHLERAPAGGPPTIRDVETGAAVAVIGSFNPLGADASRLPLAPDRMNVLWSGTFGENLFDAHPATWLTPGHEALRAFCAEIGPVLQKGRASVCFRPHCRHVLSDPQSCLTFLREQEGGPFGVALDPAGMLEPSMLPTVEDHLQRMFEALGPVARLVFLHDADVDADADGIRPAPPGAGRLPSPLIRRLVDEYVPSQTPVVIDGATAEQGRAWLGLAGNLSAPHGSR